MMFILKTTRAKETEHITTTPHACFWIAVNSQIKLMEDSHVENVSAFGFYKPPKVKSPAVKAKARNKKIKSKFDDLCNKKKKGKKVALKRRAVQSNGVEDWSVRRLHFNDLQKNGQSKQSEQEEDSRVIGKRLLQWVLHPRDVDQVMR